MSRERFPYRGLGYVGVEAPDLEAWRNFALGVCGMMPARVPPGASDELPRRPNPDARGLGADGTLYLKLDDHQWRLAIHPGDQPGIRYVGLELGDLDAVARAADVLSARGAKVAVSTPEEREARGVGAMVSVEDPAGHRLELFAAPLRDLGFVSPHGADFLTGGMGMGHVVLYVPDIDAALDFYRNVLGFERSDFTRFGPDSSIHFLRCTPRHHSVALLRVGDFGGLQHMMFEMTSLDAVGSALDRARAEGVTISADVGRHRNDRNVSFYMNGPSGFDVEIGWDGILVGDDWVENEFTGGGDLWGHAGLGVSTLEPDD